MKITYFQRCPTKTVYSIENVFSLVRLSLPKDFHTDKYVIKYHSTTIFKCIYNIIEAYFHRGDLNHITGDIHYINYLLPPKRTLLSIMDSVLLEKYKGLRRFIIFFFWYWLPEKRCKYISTISESSKRQLLKHLKCDRDKIKVIYCPLSKKFKHFPKKFNDDKPVLLHIGTDENKNLMRVSDSLKHIKCHLRIIGLLNNEQKFKLENNYIDYSSVSNLTYEQVINEYVNCDAVLFVSTYEGFGMPIIEAQAIGRPVITSNILSMPEIAGNGACFVDPFNVNSIQKGILSIINDAQYRNTIIQNGLSNINKYDLDTITKQYIDIYKNMANN